MNSQLAHDDCRRIRSTICKLAKQTVCVCFCVLTTWILIDTDNFFKSDDIMTSLFKKLSIFIKIGVIKRYVVYLVSFKIVDRIRRQSSRIVYTPPTRLDSFVSSASAVCIGLKCLNCSAYSLNLVFYMYMTVWILSCWSSSLTVKEFNIPLDTIHVGHFGD